MIILRVGLLTGVILPSTGSLCQYFRPSQSRLVAMLACVTGSVSITPLAAEVLASAADVAVGWPRSKWGGGGERPPRTMLPIRPCCCMARIRLRCIFVSTMDVRPSRALVTLLR